MTVSHQAISRPHPRQELVLLCPFQEILYGGSAGCGKSKTIVFAWVQHEIKYGNKAKGLVLRKTNSELADLIRELQDLFSNLKHPPKWNVTNHTFTHHSGAVLEMGYLDKDDDKFRYHGLFYCVAKDTQIVMGDQSLRPIQDIKAGELVMTMEGPKEVLAAHKIGPKPCVAVDVWRGTSYLGRQFHPESHPILTMPWQQTAGLSQKHEQSRQGSASWSSWQSLRGARQESQGSSASGHGSVPGSCGEAKTTSPQGVERPVAACVPVMLHAPTVRQCLSSTQKPTQRHAPRRSRQWLGAKGGRVCFYSPAGSPQPQEPWQSLQDRTASHPVAGGSEDAPLGSGTKVDSLAGCHPSAHSYGGRSQPQSDTCLEDFPSLGDALEQGQYLMLLGVLGDNKPDTQGPYGSYPHPYTGETRGLSEEYLTGFASMAPCGEIEVYDLTVADTNHYISSSGLVNKNTFLAWDELTLWPSPDPYNFVKNRVRSTHGIPVTILSTSNPIGVGAQWVIKHWKINEYRNGMVPIHIYTDLETNKVSDNRPDLDRLLDEELPAHIKRWTRIFIPGKLADNPSLDHDGQYRSQLIMNPKKVRDALLGGRWDQVEGAFFEEWDPRVHVVMNFPPPKEWRRWMAGDWGTAHPYCFLWAAQAPNGEIIVYNELYGDGGEYNKGTQETASQVAEKILARESDRGERVNERYIDSSCFSGHGHEMTIAQGFAKHGVVFQPAVRAGKVGAINMFREYLKVVNGNARIRFQEQCTHAIGSIPAMQFSKADHGIYEGKDVDNHATDAAIYLMRMGLDAPPDTRGRIQALNKSNSDRYSGMGAW